MSARDIESLANRHPDVPLADLAGISQSERDLLVYYRSRIGKAVIFF